MIRLPELQYWSRLSSKDKKNILARPTLTTGFEQRNKVQKMLQQIRSRGDSALAQYSLELDGWDVRGDHQLFEVSSKEWTQGVDDTPLELRKAISTAVANLEKFHCLQIPKPISTETSAGLFCEKKWSPLKKVGLYVPGGTAPLPSTVMMLGVPARIAGCDLKIMCTPPNKEGRIHPALLAAAQEVGVNRIFKLGGAQAVAALAYGTELIPQTDKIFGPGNSWVTEAKLQVSMDSDGASIDLPAGPSEVLVIADESADPEFVAADLLAQAEHGVDSQVILVTTSEKILQATQIELQQQMAQLSRSTICEKSIAHSRWIFVETLNEAIEVSELYAPEHLILQIANPGIAASQIRTAGSVFLGPWTPESLGDYASGTNHVLPTYGYARSYSGISVESFMRSTTFQQATAAGLSFLGPVVETLANAEGLMAHSRAVRLRCRKMENSK